MNIYIYSIYTNAFDVTHCWLNGEQAGMYMFWARVEEVRESFFLLSLSLDTSISSWETNFVYTTRMELYEERHCSKH